MVSQSRAGALFLMLIGFAAGRADGQTVSAKTSVSRGNSLSISCTAAGLPNEAGTSGYYLALSATYTNSGSQSIAPVVIRFDFHDSNGRIFSSRTVVDARGLEPQQTRTGNWQMIGYPATTASLTCERFTGDS